MNGEARNSLVEPWHHTVWLGPTETPRTLVVVADRDSVGPPEPSTDYLVLDMAWTPTSTDRADVLSVRPSVDALVRRRNLFSDSFAVLDAYAQVSQVADRFTDRGVTWWHHARSWLSLHVHERLLWCYVLVDLIHSRGYKRLVVRADRGVFIDAARGLDAARPSLQITIQPVPAPPGGDHVPAKDLHGDARARIVSAAEASVTMAPPVIRPALQPLRLVRRIARGAQNRIRRRPRPPLVRKPLRRFEILDARLERMVAQPKRVLAVVMAASFHTVAGGVEERRVDPYVFPILDRLAKDGVSASIVVLGFDHRNDEDWAEVERDERLIPLSILRAWLERHDPGIVATTREKRLAGLPAVPLRGAGFDLGPAVRLLITRADPWFSRQRQTMAMAETLIRTLRPHVMFTGWEGARTAWLGAARQLGVPTLAVQHGVVYAGSPDYFRTPHPGLIRADRTCVFGPYERDVLIKQSGYAPDSVIVTGSPRINADVARMPTTQDERDRVRRELRVADGDRILLLSAGRRFIGDTVHGLSMAGRLLDGPLPGVHIVVKLHPESTGDERYDDLLAGLAEAHGYQPPPVTMVRDIDLYRLLRSVDAHLGLYSTVLTDAVLTGTPNMVAVGQAWADVIGYVDAGVATPVRTVEDVRAFMADPKAASPDDRERFLAAHYRPGDSVGRIAEAVRAAGLRPVTRTAVGAAAASVPIRQPGRVPPAP